MYFLYFLRRKCLDGRPRFLWKSSSSGDELEEGSLFSVSDWLIAASASSSSAAVPLFNSEELASPSAPASPHSRDFLAALSASVTTAKKLEIGMKSLKWF